MDRFQISPERSVPACSVWRSTLPLEDHYHPKTSVAEKVASHSLIPKRSHWLTKASEITPNSTKLEGQCEARQSSPCLGLAGDQCFLWYVHWRNITHLTAPLLKWLTAYFWPQELSLKHKLF